MLFIIISAVYMAKKIYLQQRKHLIKKLITDVLHGCKGENHNFYLVLG